jgi:hypothetical protein
VFTFLPGVLHAENDDFLFDFINHVIVQIHIASGDVLEGGLALGLQKERGT